MPADSPNDLARLRARAMEVVGRQGRVQVLIDTMLAKSFLERSAPNSAVILYELAIKRIHDSRRSSLVLAIAKDLGSTADLTMFQQHYAEAREARNLFAHHAVQYLDETSGTLVVGGVHEGSESRFSAAELDELVLICRWLEAQVMFLIYESPQLGHTMYLDGRKSRVLKPTRMVRDWDGVLTADA